MLALEAAQAACSILLPYAIKKIMDAVALAQLLKVEVWNEVEPALWLFAGLNFGIVLFSRASGAMLVLLGPTLRLQVRRELFSYLQGHSQRYFLSHFAGSLANRISEVALGVANTLWTVLFDFWPLIITFSVSLVLMMGVNLQMALTLALWIAVYVLISFFLARRCRRYAQKYAAARSLVSGKIVDSVTNIQNAKLFARREYEQRYLEDYLLQEVNIARRTFWFMERIRWFQFVAAMILMLGIIGYALKIWSENAMTVSEFAMSASLSLMLIEQARGLSRRFLEFFEYTGNINDGVSRIIQSHEIMDHVDAQPLIVTHATIQFQQIDFSYVNGRPVFQSLNITIRSGEKIGLVGFSGSGKSTLFNLLLRLFEPQSGTILIDQQNIQAVTQESLRNSITMIPQDPILFHRSLLENIRYGRLNATDDEVIAAAQKAHAHEFIVASEAGYQTLVGERGVKLSGGQRQRITLARAILKNTSILLLDEATSALDSVTEHHIQDSLAYLMRDKTVMVIAHRLSTLSHLDRILVFQQGKIVEEGSHNQLLQRKGHYAQMWSMQAGGFLPQSEL
ncbi:MAG TPA: ABC transporter ATP-binding protein [Methylococcaceae bacterium]|nr:ABC transporter ATP-binding protein [Methylococcaceae bacterium]HIN68730.1 ABC transporter ATP-binding protein [Methylococcales bacterium]HIA45039.1 ABC transporter ATP-binding protein [Methylococcaceae bacterium]HIB61584.1 ABC transporter ATP-binding protein [Methylococcaceae bacterium]HIO13232.1 ABC transporter ATP-binding protein [Methylococcales bacterium]